MADFMRMFKKKNGATQQPEVDKIVSNQEQSVDNARISEEVNKILNNGICSEIDDCKNNIVCERIKLYPFIYMDGDDLYLDVSKFENFDVQPFELIKLFDDIFSREYYIEGFNIFYKEFLANFIINGLDCVKEEFFNKGIENKKIGTLKHFNSLEGFDSTTENVLQILKKAINPSRGNFGTIFSNVKISIDDIDLVLAYLRGFNDIKFGIDFEKLVEFLEETKHRTVKIASNIEAIKTIHDSIEDVYVFNKESRPVEEKGRIDLRTLETSGIDGVKKGDIIAKLIPGMDGKIGLTIDGKPIRIESRKFLDIKDYVGENTNFTNKDGFQVIISEIEGFPKYEISRTGKKSLRTIFETLSDKIYIVDDTYNEKDRIGTKTGNRSIGVNANYKNDKGVSQGFKEDLKGNAHIGGEVEGEVIVEGNLTVTGYSNGASYTVVDGDGKLNEKANQSALVALNGKLDCKHFYKIFALGKEVFVEEAYNSVIIGDQVKIGKGSGNIIIGNKIIIDSVVHYVNRLNGEDSVSNFNYIFIPSINPDGRLNDAKKIGNQTLLTKEAIIQEKFNEEMLVKMGLQINHKHPDVNIALAFIIDSFATDFNNLFNPDIPFEDKKILIQKLSLLGFDYTRNNYLLEKGIVNLKDLNNYLNSTDLDKKNTVILTKHKEEKEKGYVLVEEGLGVGTLGYIELLEKIRLAYKYYQFGEDAIEYNHKKKNNNNRKGLIKRFEENEKIMVDASIFFPDIKEDTKIPVELAVIQKSDRGNGIAIKIPSVIKIGNEERMVYFERGNKINIPKGKYKGEFTIKNTTRIKGGFYRLGGVYEPYKEEKVKKIGVDK